MASDLDDAATLLAQKIDQHCSDVANVMEKDVDKRVSDLARESSFENAIHAFDY